MNPCSCNPPFTAVDASAEILFFLMTGDAISTVS